MRGSHLVFAVAAACTLAPAVAQEARQPVEDFRLLLVSAIDAADGTAKGVLIGPMAEAISTKLKASGPILLDVTTLRRYRQEGCRRFNVRFSQKGIHLPSGGPARDQTLDMGLNYCRDGQPPKSLL